MKRKTILLFVLLFSLLLVSCKKEYEINLASSDINITMEVGSSKKVFVSYTEGETLLWESLNESIVSVKDETITAVSIGKTSIKLTLKGKDISKTIEVEVVAPKPSEISLSGAKEMTVGEELQLTATVTPTIANQAVDFASTNTSVASVSATGLVKALKAGTTTIVVKAVENNAVTTSVDIVVKENIVMPEAITINGSKNLIVGSSTVYTAVVSPNAASSEVVWSVSDESIASITATGLLTAIKEGSIQVIAKSKVDDKVECKYDIVIEKEVVKPNTIVITGLKEVMVGESTTYSIEVSPTDANSEVTWKFTEENDFATIDNKGKLTALKAGKVIIVAESVMDKGVYGIYEVEIKKLIATEVFIEGPGKVIINETANYSLAIEPEGADGEFIWSVSDTSIATINQDGLLTALKVGKVFIRVVCVEDENITDEYAINIAPVEATSIKIEGPKEIIVGEENTYTVTVLPASASQKVNWVVDPIRTGKITNGVLVVTAPGEYKILAQTTDGTNLLDSFMINATAPAVESIEILGLDTTVINSDEPYTIKFLPEYSTGEVEWSVDDEIIASISNLGVLTTIDTGDVVITAKLKSDPTIMATKTVNISDALDFISVNPLYADLEVGTKVIVNEIEFFVGTSAFTNLLNVNGKLKDGTVIYLAAGVYGDDLTIDYSNVSIIGPNHLVDGRGSRFAEANITGDIYINSGINNTTISGIELSENGQVIGNSSGNIDGVKFQYNYIYMSTVDAGSGIFYFKSAADDAIFKNLSVTYCKFECPGRFGRLIRCSNTCNLTVTHSDLNGGYDGMYLAGTNETANGPGLHGEFIVDDITMTGVQQFNIFVTRYDFSLCRITNSTFFDEGGDAYGGVMDARSFNDTVDKVKVEILYNTFSNCFDWHLFRFTPNKRTAETFSAVFNYNTVTSPNVATYAVIALKESNEKMLNAEYNYFDGWTPSDSNFSLNTYCGLISRENSFATLAELQDAAFYNKLDTTGDDTLIVGTTDKLKNKTLYASLAEALAAAKENDTIILLPGTYDEEVEINKNGITIKSLNADLNPNKGTTRLEEAVFTGKITIAKKIENFTIKGIKFINEAQILNTLGDAGTADNTAVNINGFTFENNIVESGLKNASGFIYFIENGNSCYSHNISIINNKFSNTTDATASAMIFVDNNFGLVVKGNTFTDIYGTAFFNDDSTKGAAGDVEFVQNTFLKIGGDAVRFDWLTPLVNGTGRSLINISANSFNEVAASAIYLGCMNNADVLTALNIQYNTFEKVTQPIHLDRVIKNANVHVNYNKFVDIPTDVYFYNDSVSKQSVDPVPMDATNNLYMNEGVVIEFDETKIFGEVTTSPYYKTEAELPIYSSDGAIYITKLSLQEITEKLFVTDKYQLVVEYDPLNANSLGLIFESSDTSVLTVDSKGIINCLKLGTATVTVIYKENSLIRAEIEINIVEYTNVEIEFEGNGVLKVNDELQLSSKILPTNGNVTYKSSDEAIATVDSNGLVKGLGEGTVTITAKSVDNESVYSTITIVVKNTADDPLQFIIDANIGNAMARNIDTNANDKSKKTEMTYGAVSMIWFGKMNLIEKEFFPVTGTEDGNRPGTKLYSTEFIVVHDTGNNSLGGNALAHYNYAKTTEVSWHYTVDEKSIIHQFPDDEMAYHAGDGLRAFGLNDTGVKATIDKPVITITDDGYYAFNSIKGTVAAPLKNGNIAKTSDITPSGIYTTIGVNGNYYINNTYYNSTYGKISNHGGGANGIGIESCVDEGSDLYATWQNLAQLVAKLLVDNNLGLDRVTQHNNFSGKDCPMTLRAAQLWNYFLKMVEFEYKKITVFKDYTFTCVSNNPDIINDYGKIINPPKVTTVVSYTVTVTNAQGYNESVTLYSRVAGTKTIK